MKRFLSSFAIVVPSYEEGIDYYVGTLGFTLVEDTRLSPTKRWVRVSPSEHAETSILLAKAADETQRLAIGNQAGGRVFLFLHTDDFERDYRSYLAKGVEFLEDPRDEPYGRVVVFADRFTLRGRSPSDEVVEVYLERGGLDRAVWRALHDNWCAEVGLQVPTA